MGRVSGSLLRSRSGPPSKGVSPHGSGGGCYEWRGGEAEETNTVTQRSSLHHRHAGRPCGEEGRGRSLSCSPASLARRRLAAV